MNTNTFFEHKVIPQNSSTSPTENLATEVAHAFDNVGDILSRDTIYPSLSQALGNFVLNDMSYHGSSQTRSDTFSISKNTKDLSLSYMPVSAIALSYIDDTTSTEVFLTQKQPTQELTSRADFKALGRVITLGGNYVGKTLKASYTGVETAFGEANLKPNVLKNTDGTYLKPLVEVTETTFTLTYDISLQSLFNKYFNVALDSGKVYLIAKEGDSYNLIKYNSLAVDNNVLTVTVDGGLEKAYTEVLVYVLNVTVSDILTSLYKEVKEHTHSKDGLTKPIDHKSILNTYQNSASIYYKDGEIPNYNHPQFLNREGYNPSVSSAYENAMLGDLFLSALISDTDQTFKSLSKDSFKILFGDPVAGSKLYFDNKLSTLNLLTGAGLNGLNITVGNGFKALSINGNTYLTEMLDETHIKGKNNKVKIVSDLATDAMLETEALVVTKKATIAQADLGMLIIGDTKVTSDGVDTTYSSITPSLNGKLIYEAPTYFDSVTITDGVIVKATLENALHTDLENYLKNDTGNFKFVLKEKEVKIEQLSGKDSGLSLGTLNKKRKTYAADYLGKLGSAIDTNFYIETPKDSSTYFLQGTDEVILSNGKSYVFQKDVAGSIRIDNLQDWFRATVHFGETTAQRLTLAGSDTTDRNGLTIDTSRISVIGEGMDCPEGVTIFETAQPLHVIKPLGKTNVDCKSISYQGMNVGSLQVFGEAAIEGGLTIVGNTVVSDVLTADSLTINTTTNLRDLNIVGESTFSGQTVFIGPVEVSNTMSVTGALDITGSLVASDGSFEKYVNVGDTLTVGGQAIFSDDIIAQGSLTVTANFTTNGAIVAGDIKAGDARLGSINAQGSITAVGGLTAEGPAVLKGNLDVGGNLSSQGSANFKGEVNTPSLYVTDDTTLMGRLVTEGPVSMTTDSLTIGSPEATLLLYGTLQVTGLRSVFSGGVNIQGELVASSTLRVSDSITCTGALSAVTMLISADAVIKGTLTANAGEFTRKVFFLDGLTATGDASFTSINADSLVVKTANTEELYVRNSLSMGPEAKVTAYTIEVAEFIQKDPSSTSSFAGPVVFNNLARYNDKIIIGNTDIEFKRSTSGCLITDNQIKLGNNSTIEAIKFFAAKGSPVAGNRDLNAGYTFASSYIDSGVDGDTGLFATQGQDVGLDGSDIEIWIDGVRRYIFPKYDVSYTNKEIKNKDVAVTLEMLQSMQADMEAKISASVVSINSAAWPVGSIHMTMNNNDPYNIFKFGTWIRFAPGRTLVGRVTGKAEEQGGIMSDGLVGPTDWAMSAVGTTYGSFVHKLTVDELPSHTHDLLMGLPANNGRKDIQDWWDQLSVNGRGQKTAAAGGDAPHNNIQPSIIVNIWQRIF